MHLGQSQDKFLAAALDSLQRMFASLHLLRPCKLQLQTLLALQTTYWNLHQICIPTNLYQVAYQHLCNVHHVHGVVTVDASPLQDLPGLDMHLSLRTTQYLSFSSSFHSLLADSDVDCVSTALGHEMYLQLGSHTGALCESHVAQEAVWPCAIL